MRAFFPSIDNTLAAARIIAFYPYYMLGYKLSAEKDGELVSSPYGKRLIKGIAALAAGGAVAFLAYGFFRYTDNALLMYGYTDPFGAFGRIVLFVIAFTAIYALRHLSPNRKIPLLTMLGRNSLWIFLLHRPFTLWLSDLINGQQLAVIMVAAALGTFVICLAFGNDFAAKYLNRFADSGTAIFVGEKKKSFTAAKLAGSLVAFSFVLWIVLDAYSVFVPNGSNGENALTENDSADDVIYPVMSSDRQETFDNAFRITFAGDLILLKDQVKRGISDDGYDFSDVFEYAEKYIAGADYAIGVFEGTYGGRGGRIHHKQL